MGIIMTIRIMMTRVETVRVFIPKYIYFSFLYELRIYEASVNLYNISNRVAFEIYYFCNTFAIINEIQL